MCYGRSNCRAKSNVKNTAWLLEENFVACVHFTKHGQWKGFWVNEAQHSSTQRVYLWWIIVPYSWTLTGPMSSHNRHSLPLYYLQSRAQIDWSTLQAFVWPFLRSSYLIADFKFWSLRDFLEYYFGQDILLVGYLMMLAIA